MVGDEAAKLRNMLQITYPIDNGKLLIKFIATNLNDINLIVRNHQKLGRYAIRLGLHFL